LLELDEPSPRHYAHVCATIHGSAASPSQLALRLTAGLVSALRWRPFPEYERA